MTMVNATVAITISNMVNFAGHNDVALIALCAALFAIVIWAVAAWYFGIPTSESHALIAGISGAAIALQGGFSGIKRRRVGKGPVWIGAFNAFGFWQRLFDLQVSCHLLPEDGSAPGKYVFQRRTDFWRCRNVVYAWRAGWAEVYWCPDAGNCACKRRRQYCRRTASDLDDASVLGCHGPGYFGWRQEDY